MRAMQDQVEAFREESMRAAGAACGCAIPRLQRAHAVQGWSAEDILRHLHCFNLAAARSLDGDEAFAGFIGPLHGAGARTRPARR